MPHRLLDGIGLHLSAEERKAIFGSFDMNGDGQVSFEEFAGLMKKSAESKKRNTPYTPEK